jgi:dihydrofolate reductase
MVAIMGRNCWQSVRPKLALHFFALLDKSGGLPAVEKSNQLAT